jgi:hypothetical protein
VMFVLQSFSGECIRRQRVEQHFHTLPPVQMCDHKACLYINGHRKWGIMSFKLDSLNAECITSIVLNGSAS